MHVEPKSPTPLYAQIVTQLKKDTAAGVYRPGDTLPSVRGLAAELTINPNTVMRAYQILESQGIITSRRGKGIFLSAKAPRRCRKELGKAALAQLGELVARLRGQGISEPEILHTVKNVLKTGRQRHERHIG